MLLGLAREGRTQTKGERDRYRQMDSKYLNETGASWYKLKLAVWVPMFIFFSFIVPQDVKTNRKRRIRSVSAVTENGRRVLILIYIKLFSVYHFFEGTEKITRQH